MKDSNNSSLTQKHTFLTLCIASLLESKENVGEAVHVLFIQNTDLSLKQKINK